MNRGSPARRSSTKSRASTAAAPPRRRSAVSSSRRASTRPTLNDGVRVNIAPLQGAGLLAADVLAAKDVDNAIADRVEWRADERRWVREGKLPRPGWWAQPAEIAELVVPTFDRSLLKPEEYAVGAVIALLQRAGGSCATMRLAGAYSLLSKRALLEQTAPTDVAKVAKK